jgi:hypothetical protein
MRCFCGCGRKVPRFPLGVRSVNRRGRRIAKDVALIEGLLDRGLQSPNAEAFVKDGHSIQAALREAVHDPADPGPRIEAQSRDLLRRARERFITARIGKAARRAGLSAEEAADAMARGEFDPFAN